MSVCLSAGYLEHEHAADPGRDEVRSGFHGEEEPQGSDFLQAVRPPGPGPTQPAGEEGRFLR